MTSIRKEGLIGLLLTSLMILIFLGSFRATSAVFLSIPLSALATFVVLYMMDSTINTMILGGLALAFSRIIDNSVISLENIYRHLEMGAEPMKAAEIGGAEVSLAVLAATLTTVVVFFPVTFLYGVSKFLFTALALAVVISLFASYLVAMTVIPLFCSRFLETMQHGAAHGSEGEYEIEPTVAEGRSWWDRFTAGFNRNFNRSLDFYELLIKGGKDGAAITPRDPDHSLVLQRVTLSPSDRHFMPAEGRTPLTAEEIAVLRAWILAGASPTATSIPGIASAERDTDLPIQPVGDYRSLIDEIRQMQRSQAAKLVPVSAKPSDGLILRTTDAASTFDDGQLARFQRFAPFIVEAELGRTAVSDACFDTLSKFANLRALHLEGTAITGRSLAKLASLSQLTYLNLSGTKVTADALASLKGVPNLHHIYLFDTPAEPASADPNNPLRSTQ